MGGCGFLNVSSIVYWSFTPNFKCPVKQKSEGNLVPHIDLFPSETGFQAGTCRRYWLVLTAANEGECALCRPTDLANDNDDGLISGVENFSPPPPPFLLMNLSEINCFWSQAIFVWTNPKPAQLLVKKNDAGSSPQWSIFMGQKNQKFPWVQDDSSK